MVQIKLGQIVNFLILLKIRVRDLYFEIQSTVVPFWIRAAAPYTHTQTELAGSNRALATDVLLTSVIHSWIKVLLLLTLGYTWAVVEMSSATTPPDSDPAQRRRVHNMLKLYYGLNEEGKAAEQAESLGPCDINGPHFDPEIYLNKVLWWIMINSECLLFVM